MKTIGIVGGIGPESTITYYRLLVAAYRERHYDSEISHDSETSVYYSEISGNRRF